MRNLLLATALSALITPLSAQSRRAAGLGLHIGVLSPGKWNAITDVPGVRVGHTTLNQGDSVHTGVTAVIPATGNLFQQKLPAAIFVGNGFGKLAGSTQVQELGNIEVPIILTNTLSVGIAIQAVVEYTLKQKGNENIYSVNAVVGETNDAELNDIRGMHIKKEHVWQAIDSARSGPVEEGCVGAGTGTTAFGWKGGIGTSSRKIPASLGGYTVGAIVQTNFGGVLDVDGVPVGKELKKYYLSDKLNDPVDGSCMMIIATDAPLDSRNLGRLAKRAFMGLAQTGGIASNGSGDYVIAFSTNDATRIPHQASSPILQQPTLHNDYTSPLFMAAIEATEEAIINSLLAARTTKGKNSTVEALPIDQLIDILKRYNKRKS